MKKIYLIIMSLMTCSLNPHAIAAPICGDWNNYENCIDPPPSSHGIDQGTISKTHYDNFINHVKPNFEQYRQEQSKNNATIQKSFDDEIDKINDYFIKYAKGIVKWKQQFPGSFYDYFSTHDERQVLLEQKNKFNGIIKSIYQQQYDSYIDLYVKLNQKAVERIEYYYYAKAYAPTVSGKWGFQPEYRYGYTYDVLDGISFISEGGDSWHYTALTFKDKWNSANSQPSTKTFERTVYLQINQSDFSNRINKINDDFINAQVDDTVPYGDQIAYVMEFESKLLQVLTLDSLDDKATKHFLYGLSYVDHISKEDILQDVFYATQNYAESNAISLVYAYSANRENQEFLAKLQKKLEEVKQLPWYKNANELYKQIIEGILAENDLPINIVLDYRYIEYILDKNKIEIRGWAGDINKGDMRSYVNVYSNDQLEVFKAKLTTNYEARNLYYPTNQQSNENWEFIGVIFDRQHYQDFMQTVAYKPWGENTFPGDIHKSNGMYFTPRFSGNPSNGNRSYPTTENSDDNWFYLGNQDKPENVMYGYIVYMRFYHDLYSQMLKLWLFNVQNNNPEHVDISIPYQQINRINTTLFSLLTNSERAWRYSGYALIDTSLILNVDADLQLQYELTSDFLRLFSDNIHDIVNLPDVVDIPSFEDVFQKWSNGEWNPPDEFNESWYPRALHMFNNDPDQIRLHIKDILDDGINPYLDELAVSFSNTNLISLINAMAITANLTISTVELASTSVLATIFGIFL